MTTETPPQMAVTVEQLVQAMYDACPHKVVSQALSEQTGFPVGTVLTFEAARAGGANFAGLYRYAEAAHRLQALAEPATGGGVREVLEHIVNLTENEPDEHPVSLATRLMPIRQVARDALKVLSTTPSNPPAPSDGVLPLEASKCHAVSEDAINHLEIRSPLNRAIYKAIRDYRMGNMGDEDGYPYPLVDLMSNPEPSDISTEEMQMIALADDVCEAVEKALTNPAGEGGNLPASKDRDTSDA